MKYSRLLIGIFLVSLVLRILAITIPINADEFLWMDRGSNFMRHLLEVELTKTYQRHHPGVPNMWLTGSSMVFNCLSQKLFPLLTLNQSPDLKTCLSTDQFSIILYVIPRLVQAVITSACMVYFYVLTKQLLGSSVALCSISLLLLEPFFLAYQRYLTTDALMADFSILALLLLLLYLRGYGSAAPRSLAPFPNRRLLVLSGVFMGLATASKVTALFCFPAVAIWIVLIELGFWRASFPQRGWKRQRVDIMLWGITILAVFILICPAMWVSPSYVLGQMYKGLFEESARGNFFFLGQVTDSPGILFYPLVLAYRLSPVLQVGLLAASAVLLIPGLRRRSEKIPELAALALIPLCVLFMLSLSESKIDRYSTLFFPVLALLAAVGWLETVVWLKYWGQTLQRLVLSRSERRKPLLRTFQGNQTGRWRNRGVMTAIALALLQLIVLLPYYPYYVTYYNPILGGPHFAKHLFMIGQGEGLDLAADWLNKLPNAKEIKVASWYGPSFAAYFQGQTIPISKEIGPDPQPWTQANRVVLYYNQFQRQLPQPQMISYFAAQQPLYTVLLHDIDYVQVYPGPVPLPEDLKSIQFPLSLSFGKVRLLGYELNTSKLSSSQELMVTFYWEFIAPLVPDATISVGFLDGNGNLLNRLDARPLNGYLSTDKVTPGTFLRDVHKLTIAPGVQPDRYRLQVGWFSPSQGQVLATQTIGEIEVGK